MQAQAGKGGFLTHKGLLYHQDQVEGQAVGRFCVPQGRRVKILQLARESTLSDVQSCCTCSSRARPVTTDRVPLTRIPRTGEFGRFVTPTPAFVSIAVFSPELESDKIAHRTP